MRQLTVTLKKPHSRQEEFINSPAKRKVIRAGRRGGKTTGMAILAVETFLAGGRVLYATPTQEQVDTFWTECKLALQEPIEAGCYYKNETRHVIERVGTDQRIRAKTAWDADTLRGDWAGLLILDEWQLMDPSTWTLVGAPMLLDNGGNAVFIYTKQRGAKGKHADEMYRRAAQGTTGRWAVFNFSSHDNPHLDPAALVDIVEDMTQLAYRMEILAEDIEDDPDALWSRDLIERYRVLRHPTLIRVVEGVDPPGSTSTECGIITGGIAIIDDELHAFIIDDRSCKGSPEEWGAEVVAGYHLHKAGRVLGEKNFGGDMVESVIRAIDESVSYKGVTASRGKAVRAEPVSALYERGRVHHVGSFSDLEDEMCTWVPGMSWSPNRLDALVWVITELLLQKKKRKKAKAGVWG